MQHFLSDLLDRKATLGDKAPFHVEGLAIGSGTRPLEVVVATHAAKPNANQLQAAWHFRNAGRAASVLVVVLYRDKVALCGPTGQNPLVMFDLDQGQVERVCRDALAQPDHHSALRVIHDNQPHLETELAGVRNSGFLASHELSVGVPRRSDWEAARQKATGMVSKRGEDLLRALGFDIERQDSAISILRSHERKMAVAVLLHPDETIENPNTRFAGLTPISYALSVANRENLDYVIITHGSRIRLYPTRVGVGVGRRSPTETFVECHLGLLRDIQAAYLWLLFSADALLERGSLNQILEASCRFAGSLAENLRERIYGQVLPRLAQGIAAARKKREVDAEFLDETYRMALIALFRLLFIAYAEDKDLLPYSRNQLYRRQSLKTKAQELLKVIQEHKLFDESNSLWSEIQSLWEAVNDGNTLWGIPPYNGGLFSTDAENFPEGAELEKLKLPNSVFGPVLSGLLLSDTEGVTGPVDFRSIGVSEFGTIYEGLLESELSIAEMDLGIGQSGLYQPVRKGQEPLVRKGEIYLHHRSGARKSTGTYFTKSFAVEHLLDRALEPALKDHLGRLDKLSDEEAAEQFFDFRVADIAMGSGHFLTAAIDRIERSFRDYLAARKLPDVLHELAKLKTTALGKLEELEEQSADIEDTQLLRRLIARRCIYGVDLNETAVQLARLAVWIHTFVPGLPLSFLNHNLKCGNSVIGIGQFHEIEEYIGDGTKTFFSVDADSLLGEAKEPLLKMATLLDATPEDIKRAQKALDQAREKTLPAEALCDITTADRIEGQAKLDVDLKEWDQIRDTLFNSRVHQRAWGVIEDLKPLHFPIAFPEVFLRERAGFDVILGNPPWEKPRVEEHAFWARHFPGMRAMAQVDYEAEKRKHHRNRPDLVAVYERELEQAAKVMTALTSGGFPGMGTGDPDLYKAFCWRFWRLIAEDGGYMGVVLPRSALMVKGSTEFRIEVFTNSMSVDVVTLKNSRGWVFENVTPQYTVGLVLARKRLRSNPQVALKGPYRSLERFVAERSAEPAVFKGSEIMAWTDTASLPLLPAEESLEVFIQLRKSPRLDSQSHSWRARPYRELDATNDKPLMDVKSKTAPSGFWPIYKGESFDLWNPDTGTYYAYGDPAKLIPHLQTKRLRGAKLEKSVFFEFTDKNYLRNEKTLACNKARIAFRDISRATDTRTVRVALLPPKVFIVHLAPSYLWPAGDDEDVLYLLGVLSSIPLDWYARRFVETHLTFFVIDAFPIPRHPAAFPLRKRAVTLAGRLACSDERFAEWAEAVGVEWGPLDEDEKQDKIHELDAVVAHLYGLSEKHLRHIFETFHEGWDYEGRLEATLRHYQQWKSRL